MPSMVFSRNSWKKFAGGVSDPERRATCSNAWSIFRIGRLSSGLVASTGGLGFTGPPRGAGKPRKILKSNRPVQHIRRQKIEQGKRWHGKNLSHFFVGRQGSCGGQSGG